MDRESVHGLLKCYEKATNCFARFEGHCQLLESFVDDNGVRHPGNKFDEGCPFYKSAEEAGGTYQELCKAYPIIKQEEA